MWTRSRNLTGPPSSSLLSKRLSGRRQLWAVGTWDPERCDLDGVRWLTRGHCRRDNGPAHRGVRVASALEVISSMDVTWLLVVMALAVFVSLVVLAVVCLRCRNERPLVSIRQTNGSEESSEFRVIHPSQPTIHRSSAHPSSNLLSPYSPSAHLGTQQRHPSFTPTETESNPSYENPADGPDYINDESDIEDPGYIVVLPEGEAPLANQSRASTPSSGVRHDYENVPEKKEDREYLNVDPMNLERSTPELSGQSDSDDDDDDEGNYVNVHDGTLMDKEFQL